MKNNLIKFSVFMLALGLFAACGSIRKAVSHEARPFEKRKFDAAAWRRGDAQTRGEMSEDLQFGRTTSNNYYLSRQSRREVLEMLGEPDRKTRGRCCGAGGTFEEEVWLYEVEISRDGAATAAAHFQIYFTDQGEVDETRVALWDDKNPDYFPRVG